MEKH
jgi:hypothetical protein